MDDNLPPKPRIVGPDGTPLGPDEPKRARGNNGRFVKSPKRQRSQRNKERHAEMRAQEAEAKYQAERQRRLDEAFRSGGFAAVEKLRAELMPDSISEALERRRRKRKT